MIATLALLAVAAVHDVALRASCDASEDSVATVRAGTPVEIRFAVSDGSNCYKIAAAIDGKQVTGYVEGSALGGLSGFEQQIRASTPLDGATFAAAAPPQRIDRPIPRTTDPQLAAIVDLLNANQPGKALERAEPLLRKMPNNATLLALAGIASYRSDELKRALDFWQESMRLNPDPVIERMYRSAVEESKADKSGEKLYGMHFALRYEGSTLQPDVARSMLGVLDEEYARISAQIGCVNGERIDR